MALASQAGVESPSGLQSAHSRTTMSPLGHHVPLMWAVCFKCSQFANYLLVAHSTFTKYHFGDFFYFLIFFHTMKPEEYRFKKPLLTGTSLTTSWKPGEPFEHPTALQILHERARPTPGCPRMVSQGPWKVRPHTGEGT